MNADRQPQLQALLAEVARNGADLVQREFRLFKAETRASLSRLAYGLAAMIIAAGFLIAGIVLLAESLVEALAVRLESEALAAAIVGGGCLILALVIFFVARSSLSLNELQPTRSMKTVRRDAEMLAEKIS